MERWRQAFREHVAPLSTRSALCGLLGAAGSNSDQLLTEAATEPLEWVQDGKAYCCGACPLAFLGWYDLELDTVGQVYAEYLRLLREIAARAGKTAICCLENYICDHRREVVLSELAFECDFALVTGNYRDAEIQQETSRFVPCGGAVVGLSVGEMPGVP